MCLLASCLGMAASTDHTTPCRLAPGKSWLWCDSRLMLPSPSQSSALHFRHLPRKMLVFPLCPPLLVLPTHTILPAEQWALPTHEALCVLLETSCRHSSPNWGSSPSIPHLPRDSFILVGIGFCPMLFPFQWIWSYDFSSSACLCGRWLWFLSIGSAFICSLKHK